MKLVTKAGVIFDRILGALAFVAAAILVLVTLAAIFEVVMRYFLNRPQVWVSYFVMFAIVFITFLSTAWVLKREGHVKMDLVLSRLKPRPQSLLNVILSIVSAIVWLVVAWYSAWVTWDLFQSGAVVTGILDVPKAPCLAPIPLGSFLPFIQCLRRTHGYWRGWRGS